MTGYDANTLIILGVVVAIYLVPTIVATARQRPNVAGIAAVNILAGWTVIGWVLPLVWALASDRPAAATYLSSEARPDPAAGEAAFESRIVRAVLWILGAGVLIIAAMALLR